MTDQDSYTPKNPTIPISRSSIWPCHDHDQTKPIRCKAPYLPNRIPEAAVLRCGLARVARHARHGLPVALIPEQRWISAMRDLVIHHVGGPSAAAGTVPVLRSLKECGTGSSPGGPISALRRLSAYRRLPMPWPMLLRFIGHRYSSGSGVQICEFGPAASTSTVAGTS